MEYTNGVVAVTPTKTITAKSTVPPTPGTSQQSKSSDLAGGDW